MGGYLWKHIISPFFIPRNNTGQIDLDILENAIYPALVQVLENVEDHQTIIFQEDGALPQCVQPVRQFLDEKCSPCMYWKKGTY